MRKIERLLSEYGESHQNPTNKAVHWICVPVIFWSITALLWCVKLPFNIPSVDLQMNMAIIALVLAFIYYISLSLSLAIGMLLFSCACVVLSYKLEQVLVFPLWAFALIAFALAWVGQFWGHKVEGKKPSFLKDLQFLLIGPAWLMHFIYGKMGVKY